MKSRLERGIFMAFTNGKNPAEFILDQLALTQSIRRISIADLVSIKTAAKATPSIVTCDFLGEYNFTCDRSVNDSSHGVHSYVNGLLPMGMKNVYVYTSVCHIDKREDGIRQFGNYIFEFYSINIVH